MMKTVIAAVGLALIAFPASAQGPGRFDDRYDQYERGGGPGEWGHEGRGPMMRDRGEGRYAGQGRRPYSGPGRDDHDDDEQGPGGSAAHFFVRSGDTELRVVCSDQEQMRACVDAATSLLDRVQSRGGSSTSPSTPSPGGSPSPSPAR